VTLDFLYWNPKTDASFCDTCPIWQARYQEFTQKNNTVNTIQTDYEDKVQVVWIDYYSDLGIQERLQHDIPQPNSLVINNETVIEGEFNETVIREIIDAYLLGTTPPPPPSSELSLIAVLALAFSFGFFETFSPCLIVLLSFILSYSLGEATEFKQGMLQVTFFGIGFVIAALSLGLTVALLFFQLRDFSYIMTWIISIFSLFFGLTQLGLFKKASFETKPLIKNLSRKYAFTYGGLFVLGFLFYFLDPCIAPIFFAMIPLLSSEFLLLTLLVFCIGVIIPFIGIGILAGSISKLARSSYKHKSKIKAVSGIILIAYALYLIVFHLIL